MGTFLQIAFPLALACYYLVAWLRVRRQPEYHPVVVQFEPAEGLSPAAARYVWKGAIDQRTVACVFAQLAVKGLIRIEAAKGCYHIKRTNPSPTPSVTREEQVALDWLFSNFLTENNFKPTQDSQGCIAALTGALQKQAGGLYRATHYGYIALGVMLSLVAVFATASTIRSADRVGVFILSWILFMTGIVGAIVLWTTFISSIIDLARGIGNFSRLFFGILVSAFVMTCLVMVAIQLNHLASTPFVVSVMLMAALNSVAGFFLRSTTSRGMAVQQQLEGFREFLMAVEQDRLDRFNLPRTALQSKERNLAYAIALEIKEAWGDELANACYPQIA
jgi:hypothetical protein